LKEIHRLLLALHQKEGSDLHLAEGLKPRIRVHGDLTELSDESVLTRQALFEHMATLVGDRKFQDFLKRGDLDFAWEWEGVARFRANFLIAQHGLGAVFRLIPESVVPWEKLHMPEAVLRMTRGTTGLLLVTGATGSGKSTTLAALIDAINASRACHIITIEDPIELVHTRKKAFITQREVGTHADSFSTALQGAIREDPDVVMVGEIREPEAASLALEAAEMGFLVMATLHSNGAVNTIHRMLDMFPAKRRVLYRQQLANCLVGVVSQTLLKRTGGKGRIAACEILVATSQLRSLLREGQLHQIPSVFQQGATAGCQTMDQGLIQLAHDGLVDRDEAVLRLKDKTLANTI
jgi:twitching motility protein PilT